MACAMAAAAACWNDGVDEQGGVGGVAHVAALNEHLGHRRQVEAGQVVAGLQPVDAVVGADGHGRAGGEGVAQRGGEGGGGRDDAVVGTVRRRLQHGEAAPVGRPAVGVDVDRHVGVGVVDDGGPRRDARPDAVVVRAGQHDGGPLGLQVGFEIRGHVEVELRLGVPAVGRRPRGVAGLGPGAVEDGLVDDARRAVVQAVVAGVDPHHLARQRLGADGQPVARCLRRCGHSHDGAGQRRAAERAEVAGVPVGEDAAVPGHQPVAAAVGRGRHAGHRRIEVEGAGRAVEGRRRRR